MRYVLQSYIQETSPKKSDVRVGEPEGLATKLQDVRLIGESVQPPSGKPFIAKHMKLVQTTKYLDCDIILFLSGMV